jgi:hypothetical protein
MQIDLNQLLAHAPALGWWFAGAFLFFWLKPAFTPVWVRGLLESEGEPSARIVLAVLVVVFTLFMQSAGRLSELAIEANYAFAGILLGLGTAKIVGKAFASRPASPPAEIKADKAQVDVQGDATITGATTKEQP